MDCKKFEREPWLASFHGKRAPPHLSDYRSSTALESAYPVCEIQFRSFRIKPRPFNTYSSFAVTYNRAFRDNPVSVLRY